MENTSIRIKEALKIRDMKQSELSKLTGISKGALSSYISGTYEPKQRNIYKIAEALNETKSTFNPNVITKKDEKSIQKDLKQIMDDFKNGQDGPAFYNGVELGDEELELIEQAMELALRSAKIKNKAKYTPKKYRK
ncbi:MAG: helix-turn-helix transcriptional regulator [Paeniclostridium sordellii]|nr:helix-turn-helix transcriptional regulator [Paeniclostridium sordellii]